MSLPQIIILYISGCVMSSNEQFPRWGQSDIHTHTDWDFYIFSVMMMLQHPLLAKWHKLVLSLFNCHHVSTLHLRRGMHWEMRETINKETCSCQCSLTAEETFDGACDNTDNVTQLSVKSSRDFSLCLTNTSTFILFPAQRHIIISTATVHLYFSWFLSVCTHSDCESIIE